MDHTTATQVVVLHDCMIKGEVALKGTVMTVSRAEAFRLQTLEAVSMNVVSKQLPTEKPYEAITSAGDNAVAPEVAPVVKTPAKTSKKK